MSALCLNALRGSFGAALVLAHVQDFLDALLKPIGTSWLVRNPLNASKLPDKTGSGSKASSSPSISTAPFRIGSPA
jgi:hypothetical protein